MHIKYNLTVAGSFLALRLKLDRMCEHCRRKSCQPGVCPRAKTPPQWYQTVRKHLSLPVQATRPLPLNNILSLRFGLRLRLVPRRESSEKLLLLERQVSRRSRATHASAKSAAPARRLSLQMLRSSLLTLSPRYTVTHIACGVYVTFPSSSRDLHAVTLKTCLVGGFPKQGQQCSPGEPTPL